MKLSKYTTNYITIFLFVAIFIALLTGCGPTSTTNSPSDWRIRDADSSDKDCPQGQVYSYTTKDCVPAEDHP